MNSFNLFLSFLFYLFVLYSSFSLFVQADDELVGTDINHWCQTTPHPNQCNFFLGRGKHHVPRHRTDFRMLALQAAVDNANEALGCTRDLGKMCQTMATTAVWNDCYKLLNNTVFQLNQTLVGLKNNRSSNFDAQTWLSAAFTNLQTCFSGCVEMNLTDFASPIKSSNLTEMISNSLAINHLFLNQNPNYDFNTNDFPAWVTHHDRRLLATTSIQSIANVIVSQTPDSRFPTIQSALDYARSIDHGDQRFIIYIKGGVYNENIQIVNDLKNIMFVGDGIRYTIITGNRSARGGSTTYSSATVGVDCSGFIARGITFRNTAGPESGQAVALRSASDLSVFYACSFEGYQDTLFAVSQRQFFKLCYISGTIDFIFGNAAVVFQNCVILVRKPLNGQANMITAQGRGDPFQNTGISIHNCRIIPTPELIPVVSSVQTYLGRPWQEYSRTVFMKTYLDGFINPQGWSPWGNTDFAFNTLYYGEYGCFGPGAAMENRVKWAGYHANMSSSEARMFTVEGLIAGRAWLPATAVPFIAGL
ncbi:pectinesterase-like [Cynara cardunculus var. scolymus]|uniref:Pectinesterase n=1 Tax=Cynara cardunculus var. scolymus TaxID=59895 RepID=A0A124SFW4_CYNCS|nr:pectinesterase-like [Cynara cardunculus var. scolymus]KVI04517.1 Pectinesterase, active site-containing protein [Cynara cardunculus var. scolymus]